jgi:hypothetical protein
MTPQAYRKALKKLGLRVTGPAMRQAIGISDRMSQYYAAGNWPVPPTVELALEALEQRTARGGEA